MEIGQKSSKNSPSFSVTCAWRQADRRPMVSDDRMICRSLPCTNWAVAGFFDPDKPGKFPQSAQGRPESGRDSVGLGARLTDHPEVCLERSLQLVVLTAITETVGEPYAMHTTQVQHKQQIINRAHYKTPMRHSVHFRSSEP